MKPALLCVSTVIVATFLAPLKGLMTRLNSPLPLSLSTFSLGSMKMLSLLSPPKERRQKCKGSEEKSNEILQGSDRGQGRGSGRSEE
jgi:hypothetical protein